MGAALHRPALVQPRLAGPRLILLQEREPGDRLRMRAFLQQRAQEWLRLAGVGAALGVAADPPI
jgi:hypothetical protein